MTLLTKEANRIPLPVIDSQIGLVKAPPRRNWA